MRVLFGAQGGMLSVLQEIDVLLRKDDFIEDSAYWISDAEYYYRKKNSLPLKNVTECFEWDYTKGVKIPEERKTEILNKYKSFNLWDAIVADRRLMFGKSTKYRQQYACKFTDEQLYNIVIATLSALDELVIKFSPNVIVTFVPATFGDYLLYYVAKANNVDYRQLRSTKIVNYMILSRNFGAVSDEIDQQYKLNMLHEDYNYAQEAGEYIEKASAAPMVYEGSLKKGKISLFNQVHSLAYSFLAAAKKKFSSVNKFARTDNHVPPPFSLFFYGQLLAPYNRRRANSAMKPRMISLDDAKNTDYVFFPLHSEPEIAISVNGRNYQNQIEAIRRIAQSLPIGWTLVVKEHPRSFAYRTVGYYKKLMEIPNVRFAAVEVQPYYWIKHSKAVTTISGFVGFEAVVVGKPVIVLGDVMFKQIPDTMLRTIDGFTHFFDELLSLLEEYRYDPKPIKAYIAACMEKGVSLNMYSVLLSKSGRESMGDGQDINTEYERMAQYFKSSLAMN